MWGREGEQNEDAWSQKGIVYDKIIKANLEYINKCIVGIFEQDPKLVIELVIISYSSLIWEIDEKHCVDNRIIFKTAYKS